MDYIDIKELANIFNISKDEAYKVVLHRSNKNGIKIMHEVEGNIVIGDEYFNKILQHHDNIESCVPDYQYVVENALTTVPFQRGAYVYFLLSNNKIVYIGQSVTPAARIGKHIADGKEFDTAYVMDVEEAYMPAIELACIMRYLPEYSGSFTSGDRMLANRIDLALR